MLINIPNKKLQFVYDDGVKRISFETIYLVKIIDYGRVFLRKHTDSFVKYMTQKDKNNRAFSFLVNNNKESRLKYITSYKRNRSYDLQALVNIRNLYALRANKSDNKSERVFENKRIFLNKIKYGFQNYHGTPELGDSKDKKTINTVEDAYVELKNTIVPFLDKNINDKRLQLLCTYTIDTTVILNDHEIHVPFGFEMSKSHKGK